MSLKFSPIFDVATLFLTHRSCDSMHIYYTRSFSVIPHMQSMELWNI